MSAVSLRDALARRECSVAELTELVVERILAENGRLGAFSFIDADAAERRARSLDAQYQPDARERQLLWGMPTADKDLSDRVGMPTGHGSAAGGEFPEVSSPEVVVLDLAGALSVGKTSTPEFGLYGYTSPAIGPIARHPLDAQLGAGGSSGGAAVAVAAGLLPFAPGSDGGGSIRIPAACVGIVGMKPSRDLLPIDRGLGELTGVVTGPLARNVADAALLLDALASPWGGETPPSAESFLSATTEQARAQLGARSIALTLGSPWHDSHDLRVDPACAQALALVHRVLAEDARYVVGDAVTFPTRPYAPIFQRAWQRAAAGIDERFDRSLMEPVTRELIEAGGALTAAERAENQQALVEYGDDLARHLGRWDVVITPALAQPWHRAEGWPEDAQENFDAQVRMAPYSSWVNVAGLPAITLPTPVKVATPSGTLLAVSVQLIGRRREDRALLTVAAHLERLLSSAVVEPPR